MQIYLNKQLNMMNLSPKKIVGKLYSLNNKLGSEFYIDLGLSYKDSIFLSGVSRSGTTWVSDILNYDNEYRYIFEPFYPQEVYLCKEFMPKQYIRSDDRNSRFLESIENVLIGRVQSTWSDRFNKKFISRKRLIKSVRANLFLKWLHQRFPEMPIILLLRHPCAVATSKLKLNWQRSLDKYLNQEDLMKDFLHPFQEEIERSEHIYRETNNCFENHIFSWCIENYIPLKQLARDDIYIVFYERLCEQPEHEIQKLFTFIGKKYDSRVLESFGRASNLSRKDSSVIIGGSLTDSWRKYINDKQIARTFEILNLFGLDKIYSQEAMPHEDGLKQIMSSRNVVQKI